MMTAFIAGELAVACGISLGKFLSKCYFRELSQAAVEGFLDFGKDKLKDTIKDARAARKAEIEFEKVGSDVFERLESDLQSVILGMEEPRPDPNKIIRRFQSALTGKLAANFVIRNQIDPQKLADSLREASSRSPEPLTEVERRLFDDSTNRVAQYLFRAASKLPRFDETRKEESIAILAQLASEVSEVLEDARAIRERVVSQPLSDDADYENSYRNAVVAELDKVELFGVNLPPELKESRLTDAYVTLRLRPQDDEDDGQGVECDDQTPATVTAEEAFDRLGPRARRLLIRGGAGCGKTTLVRWAAIQAARGTSRERRIIPEFEKAADGDIRLLMPEEQQAIAADWRRRMPFVITLRNCPEGKLPRPEELPAQIGNEVGNPPSHWVQRLLHQGHALILIDGLDEVSKFNHAELFRSLNGLCAAFPKNYFVLTTRPDAVSEVRFEDLDFVPSEIEPLEEKDRDLFVRHWFQAVAQKLRMSANQAQDLQGEAEGVTREIARTPWLSQLATTPLYCAMTCALYRAQGGSLPQGLRAMCETLCEMMVDRRDRERKLTFGTFSASYAELDYAQKKLILRRLAHHFVLGGKSAIPVPDAIEQVARALAGMPQRSANEADEIYGLLLVRSGMLRSATPEMADRPATVQFIHNTFKEFLAGEQLADDAHADFLVIQLSDADETWRRVGLFAISAGTAKYQNDVLRALLSNIPEPLPRDKKKKSMTDAEVANTPRGRAIYAYRCGVSGNEWMAEIKDRLTRLTRELFPPRTVSEAEWLANAGNVVVPLLSINPETNGTIVAACVRALRLIGTSEAMQALTRFKDDKRANVIAELCKALPSRELGGVLWHFQHLNALPPAIATSLNDLTFLIHLMQLQSLNLQGTKVADLSPLQNLAQLQSLYLTGTKVADLSPLQNLAQLQSLYLTGTQVADLSPLQNLAQLQSLYLWGTQVADLSPLQNLAQLQSLNLTGTQVADLSPLQNLAQLQSLDLRGTQVADLSPLQNLAQLQSLYLRGTQVADLSPLQNLAQLQSLYLTGTQVADLSPLQNLAQLQSLDLTGTQVADLSPLQNLAQLQSLDLWGTQVADLSPLQNLAQLQSLNLQGTQVTDLSPLQNLAQLQSLYLTGTQVADLSPLQNLAQLQSLDLTGTQVADLSPLQNLAQLQSLDLRGTQVADLSPLQNLVDKGLKIFR